MAISQHRSKRKSTGGRYKKSRDKKAFELSRAPTLTKVGEMKKKKIKTLGNIGKTVLLNANIVNLYDPKNKKYEKSKIITVIECPANRHYVRRNIITKGTIIETDKGKARVVSRPGQEGSINAILV